MPRKETVACFKADHRAGKSASTQAGEFVREEIEEIREGQHGARSTKQAMAIGLSKAHRAGVKLPPPERRGPLTGGQHRACDCVQYLGYRCALRLLVKPIEYEPDYAALLRFVLLEADWPDT